MTLKEAKERLAIMLHSRENSGYHQETGALKLGILAINVVEELRHYPFPDGIVQLPGETQE